MRIVLHCVQASAGGSATPDAPTTAHSVNSADVAKVVQRSVPIAKIYAVAAPLSATSAENVRNVAHARTQVTAEGTVEVQVIKTRPTPTLLLAARLKRTRMPTGTFADTRDVMK